MIIYIVSQIVEKYSEMPGSRFKNNAVMLIIKPIEMDKNKMSNDFSEYNPGISWLVIMRHPKWWSYHV